MRQEDVSFFSKETRKKDRREKRSFRREECFFIRKEKLHTHNTLAAFNTLLYQFKRAQLTTAFLLLFLRDTLRCSHESAFLRRFIRSRYILLSVLILLLEEGAQFWQKSSGVV
jgi:hypothetical protein